MKRIMAVVAFVVLFFALFVGTSTASATPKGSDSHAVKSVSGKVSDISSAGKTGGSVYFINPKGTCSVKDDLEGAFTKSQMRLYLQCIVPMVDAWIDVVYKTMPHPVHYVYVPKKVSGILTNGGGCAFDKKSYNYCIPDGNVYVGWQMVWKMYSKDGDASSAYALAHEVTHHFQTELGVFKEISDYYGGDKKTPPNAIIPTEDQADCGGGAFLNYLSKEGVLNVKDDIGDISSTLSFVAEAESDGVYRTHGTDAERVASFNLGWQNLRNYAQPMMECVSLFPKVPILYN